MQPPPRQSALAYNPEAVSCQLQPIDPIEGAPECIGVQFDCRNVISAVLDRSCVDPLRDPDAIAEHTGGVSDDGSGWMPPDIRSVRRALLDAVRELDNEETT